MRLNCGDHILVVNVLPPTRKYHGWQVGTLHVLLFRVVISATSMVYSNCTNCWKSYVFLPVFLVRSRGNGVQLFEYILVNRLCTTYFVVLCYNDYRLHNFSFILCYVFFVSQDYRVGRMRVVVDLTMFVFLL